MHSRAQRGSAPSLTQNLHIVVYRGDGHLIEAVDLLQQRLGGTEAVWFVYVSFRYGDYKPQGVCNALM